MLYSLILQFFLISLTVAGKKKDFIEEKKEAAELLQTVHLCAPFDSKLNFKPVILRAAKNVNIRLSYPPVDCPPPFIQVAERCYFFGGNYRFENNYIMAKDGCKKFKSKLASFETEDEFHKVYNYVERLSSTITYTIVYNKTFKFWTGGRKNKGSWKWESGQDVGGPWCDYNPPDKVQGDVQMALMCDKIYSGCLCITTNSMIFGNYVCEIEPNPL